MKNKNKGFSLVELMVVISIIAILSAIATPVYSNYVKRSKLNVVFTDFDILRNGIIDFYQRDSAYPVNLEDLDMESASFEDGIVTQVRVINGKTIFDIGDEITGGDFAYILYEPNIENDTVSWKCETNLKSSLVPEGCIQATDVMISSLSENVKEYLMGTGEEFEEHPSNSATRNLELKAASEGIISIIQDLYSGKVTQQEYLQAVTSTSGGDTIQAPLFGGNLILADASNFSGDITPRIFLEPLLDKDGNITTNENGQNYSCMSNINVDGLKCDAVGSFYFNSVFEEKSAQAQ